MKAVKWYAPRDMRLEDAPNPRPGRREALIRIESVGVCGSDIHYYLDGGIGSQVITEPFILGHEYAGTVEAVGEEADPALVGKRVAVEPGAPCEHCEWCLKGQYNVCPHMRFPGTPPTQGALCEYISVPARFCFPVPENITAQEAAMIEPLAVALHTVELAHMKPGDSVAVLGLGPIGLLTCQVARFAGAGAIIGTDLLDYRVRDGLKNGADVTFNADNEDTLEKISELTGGRGVDIAFDCAKSDVTQSHACHIARPAGRVVLTGISGNEDDTFPVGISRRKELTLQWCRRFKDNYPTAIDLMSKGRLDISKLITHAFGLEDTLKAFDIVSAYDDEVLKVSIDQ